MSDPGTTYRTREEINELREKRDPIERVKSLLQDKLGVPAADVKAVDKKVRELIDDAVEKASRGGRREAELIGAAAPMTQETLHAQAKASPWPEPKNALLKDVYAQTGTGKLRGIDAQHFFDV